MLLRSALVFKSAKWGGESTYLIPNTSSSQPGSPRSASFSFKLIGISLLIVAREKGLCDELELQTMSSFRPGLEAPNAEVIESSYRDCREL